MPVVTEVSDSEAGPTWPPTTKHYAVDDGSWILVEVDDSGPSAAMLAFVEQAVKPTELVPKPMNFVSRPTVILAAGRKGFATSLTPVHKFAPGTSHLDALAQAGYTLS